MLNQLFGGDPIGAALALTLISLPISWVTSTIIQNRYTEAVRRHQNQSGEASALWDENPETSFQAAAPAPAQQTTATVQSLLTLEQRKQQAILIAYGIAGGVHALTAALWQILVYQSTMTLFKVLLLSIIFAWPLVLTIWLITSTSRQRMIQSSIGYGVGLIFVSLLAGLPFESFLLLWAGLMATPSLILWILSHRKLQAIGHFVLPIVLLSAFVVNLALSVLVSGYGLFFRLLLLGLLFTGLVWLVRQGSQWLVQQYARKQVSDRLLLIDAWWLTFTLWEMLIFTAASNLGWAVLLSFVAYKVTLWFVLQQSWNPQQELVPAPRLLWLRVFGRQKQSTELLDSIGNKWRTIGSIQMIAGTDLATTFMEPHQLIEFWLGKLRSQFIQSPEQLEERMQQIDLLPDRDGRYRITQFFCLNNNWKLIFDHLLQQSDTVMMDLRGLKESNLGVRHELETLFNQVPAQGFIILVDDPFPAHQMQTLRDLWQQASAHSPNFNHSFSELNLINVTPARTNQILKSLCESVSIKSLHP